MKTKQLMSMLLLSFTAGFNATNSFAEMPEGGSSGVGGGGDAEEARVNEIRSDILKWINDGGAQGLNLSMPVAHYEEEMKKILRNKEVSLGFTNDKVEVNGVEKTCRGFVAENKLNMLCNIKRFQATQPAAQYRLIHHEYAGLAGLEKNEGAASDYEVSNQLTDFLREEKVLRLSVKRGNMYEALGSAYVPSDLVCYDKAGKEIFKSKIQPSEPKQISWSAHLTFHYDLKNSLFMGRSIKKISAQNYGNTIKINFSENLFNPHFAKIPYEEKVFTKVSRRKKISAEMLIPNKPGQSTTLILKTSIIDVEKTFLGFFYPMKSEETSIDELSCVIVENEQDTQDWVNNRRHQNK